MKVHQITDSRNQHIVAIEKEGELRCFFKNHSMHTAGIAFNNLCRDIARHGEAVIGFDALPAAAYRTTKAGKRLLMA